MSSSQKERNERSSAARKVHITTHFLLTNQDNLILLLSFPRFLNQDRLVTYLLLSFRY